MRIALSTRQANHPDRGTLAMLGICLVLAASISLHFGFVATGTGAVVRSYTSHAKLQCLANDALQWNVPCVQFAPAPPLLSVRQITRTDEWSYSPQHNTPQLYDRPPPSL